MFSAFATEPTNHEVIRILRLAIAMKMRFQSAGGM
jgi:hypothetical protein